MRIFFAAFLLICATAANAAPISSNVVTCGNNPYAIIVLGQSNGTNEAPGPAYVPRHQTWQVSIGENLLFVSADPLGIAYKHATREIWIRNAAGWLSGDPVTGVSPTAVTADQSPLFPAVSLYGANSGTATFNFGASAFAYTPPAGFKAGVCQ